MFLCTDLLFLSASLSSQPPKLFLFTRFTDSRMDQFLSFSIISFLKQINTKCFCIPSKSKKAQRITQCRLLFLFLKSSFCYIFPHVKIGDFLAQSYAIQPLAKPLALHSSQPCHNPQLFLTLLSNLVKYSSISSTLKILEIFSEVFSLSQSINITIWPIWTSSFSSAMSISQ